jgi:hypothetical protein
MRTQYEDSVSFSDIARILIVLVDIWSLRLHGIAQRMQASRKIYMSWHEKSRRPPDFAKGSLETD